MRIEEQKSISTTTLARNVSESIDDVRISRKSVLITKGKKVIAQLSPAPKTGLSIQGLRRLLSSLPKLSSNEASQLDEDLKNIRASAKIPENPWE